MANYWLHRISYEKETAAALFDKGYLSLGWAMYSGNELIEASRTGNVVDFNEFMGSRNEESRSRWNMWYFCQFSVGDTIVVPLPKGLFAICEVTDSAKPIGELRKVLGDIKDAQGKPLVWKTDENNSTLLYDGQDGRRIDLGFVVGIKENPCILKRKDYADNALSMRMKMFQTNGQINDLIDDVTRARNKIGVGLEIVMDTLVDKLHKAIYTQLNDEKYELLVKWYFQKIGATQVWIPAKNGTEKYGAADADVIATFDFLKTTYLVQVKQHAGETGEQAVKQIYYYRDQQMEIAASDPQTKDSNMIALVISNGDSFSKKACKLAEENNVRLIGGKEFARELIESGLRNIDEAFA